MACTRSHEAQTRVRKVARHWLKWRRAHRGVLAYRRFVASLPYKCGSFGRAGIPCYVIACESGFSWSAYNSSGARGPYQFLGWDVPWPVRTWADKMAHHKMAVQLWNGGAGASNWVCA